MSVLSAGMNIIPDLQRHSSAYSPGSATAFWLVLYRIKEPFCRARLPGSQLFSAGIQCATLEAEGNSGYVEDGDISPSSRYVMAPVQALMGSMWLWFVRSIQVVAHACGVCSRPRTDSLGRIMTALIFLSTGVRQHPLVSLCS